MSNPMEQFVIKPIIPIKIGDFDISFTNSSLSMILTVFVSTIILVLCLKKRELIPSRIQLIPESLYTFILGTIKENSGTKGLRYSAFIFCIFLFIAFGNILGLFPYSFTFTSHIAAVGGLSITALLFNIFIGIKNRGLGYFRLFMPHGIPWPLAPLIVPIEIISFLAKPFSLTVRLVANMTVGHVMLKIIAGFVIALGIAGAIPIIFNSMIIMFEIFIALLQAYIYTVLSCIYLSDAVNGH